MVEAHSAIDSTYLDCRSLFPGGFSPQIARLMCDECPLLPNNTHFDTASTPRSTLDDASRVGACKRVRTQEKRHAACPFTRRLAAPSCLRWVDSALLSVSPYAVQSAWQWQRHVAHAPSRQPRGPSCPLVQADKKSPQARTPQVKRRNRRSRQTPHSCRRRHKIHRLGQYRPEKLHHLRPFAVSSMRHTAPSRNTKGIESTVATRASSISRQARPSPVVSPCAAT